MAGSGESTGASVAVDGVFTGSVAYRERIAVSPAAFSVVRLLNVASKSPVVIAQSVTPFRGRQVPVAFSLPCTGAAIARQNRPRLALDARIVFGGAAQFRTDTPVPVLQPGTPGKNVVLNLLRATPDAQAVLAGEAIAATDKALALAGETRPGSTRVGEITTNYQATYMGGRLVRIVASSTQGDYGSRTDRYYFSETTDRGGFPLLRAAFLQATRTGRASASAGNGDAPIIPGRFEKVTQRIFLADTGEAISTGKTVDKEARSVSPLDITAARNFARLLAADALRGGNGSR